MFSFTLYHINMNKISGERKWGSVKLRLPGRISDLQNKSWDIRKDELLVISNNSDKWNLLVVNNRKVHKYSGNIRAQFIMFIDNID